MSANKLFRRRSSDAAVRRASHPAPSVHTQCAVFSCQLLSQYQQIVKHEHLRQGIRYVKYNFIKYEYLWQGVRCAYYKFVIPANHYYYTTFFYLVNVSCIGKLRVKFRFLQQFHYSSATTLHCRLTSVVTWPICLVCCGMVADLCHKELRGLWRLVLNTTAVYFSLQPGLKGHANLLVM